MNKKEQNGLGERQKLWTETGNLIIMEICRQKMLMQDNNPRDGYDGSVLKE
jgi:hypothetical protein